MKKLKRLGKYTGTLYPADYDFSKCPECCVCLRDEDVNDEQYMKRLRIYNRHTCLLCLECPAVQTHSIWNYENS